MQKYNVGKGTKPRTTRYDGSHKAGLSWPKKALYAGLAIVAIPLAVLNAGKAVEMWRYDWSQPSIEYTIGSGEGISDWAEAEGLEPHDQAYRDVILRWNGQKVFTPGSRIELPDFNRDGRVGIQYRK